MVTNVYMTPRRRVLSSVAGAVPGMIAIPLLMKLWAPNWAVASWVIGYAAVTFLAWYLLLRTSRPVESWWSNTVGIWFGLLPVSAVIWDPGTKSYWIASAVVMVSIATEVSSLPYIKIAEWRFGVVTSGLLVSAAGIVDTGWVTLAMVPVLFAIVTNADRMRASKAALEEARMLAEAKTVEAETLANRDDLTGLLNRRGIAAELERIAQGPHTLLMFDANRFKSINDGHGYATGDQVIQQMGSVLAQRLSDGWIVGRQGGDEFVALAAGLRAVVPDVCSPVTCRASLFGTSTSLSIGLSGGAVQSATADSPDRILSKASYAMRAAKRTQSSLVMFDETLAVQFDRMLEVSVPTSGQINSSSLTAEFQIIVDDDEVIIGCETLSRWRRPDGTLVPPSDFLPVLADNGQMPILNEAMLEEGIAFASRFNNHERPPFVAVNIGSPSLASSDLVPLVASLLARHEVDAHRLMIEITETEGLGQTADWEVTALELKRLGILLAIDDFGSGYSNIERLNQLPISHLKFDRTLTTSVETPLGIIVRGVVEFADQTGIGIIGEGIETEQDLQAMRKVGVRHFQGFHFGRPSPPDMIEAQIKSQTESADRTRTGTTV